MSKPPIKSGLFSHLRDGNIHLFLPFSAPRDRNIPNSLAQPPSYSALNLTFLINP